MFMIDCDLHKAYDTVDRWVKEMARRRLGLLRENRVRTHLGRSSARPERSRLHCAVFLCVKS